MFFMQRKNPALKKRYFVFHNVELLQKILVIMGAFLQKGQKMGVFCITYTIFVSKFGVFTQKVLTQNLHNIIIAMYLIERRSVCTHYQWSSLSALLVSFWSADSSWTDLCCRAARSAEIESTQTYEPAAMRALIMQMGNRHS